MTRFTNLVKDGGMPRRPRTALQVDVGRRLRWAREIVYPTRSDFARAVGLDPSSIHKLEDGDRMPSAFNIHAFALKLRVTADYLLFGSLIGVHPEMIAHLCAAHPELATSLREAERYSAGIRAGIDPQNPRRPAEPPSAAA